MKRLAVAVLLACTMAFSAVHAQGSKVRNTRSTVAYPAQAELDRYPVIWTHTPSHSEVARTMKALGLQLDTLKTAWTGYNWYRGLGRFVFETIPAGTPVWVDSTGTPRYRDDCGNRLVEESKCPKCDTLQKPVVLSDSAVVHPSPSPKDPGLWARFTAWTKGLALGLWDWIENVFGPFGWLALFLLGLGFLALIVFLLWALWRFLTHSYRSAAYTSATDTDDHREPPRRPPGSGATSGPDAQSERRHIAFYPGAEGKDHMMRFKGVKDVRYEHQDEVTTIRFRHSAES